MRPTHQAQLLVLGLAVFVSMLGVGIIVPILPVYARDLGASALVMGMIFSAFSASRALTMPYVGVLSDRLGRKRFLMVGLLGYALLALALLWTRSPMGLVFNRLAQGVFAAMILPVSMALVADLSPKGMEGRIFGNFNTWFLLGFGVGPLVGGAVYDSLGVHANFLLMAGLSLASLAMVAWLVKAPPASSDQAHPPGWGQLLDLVRDRGMRAIFLCRAGQAMGMGCFIAFLPVLGQDKGISNTSVGLLLAVNVLVMTGLQFPAGRLADRWPRLPLAVWGQVLSGLCHASLPLAGGMPGLLVLVVLEGLGSGFAMPALTALMVDRGRGMGVGMGTAMGFFTLSMSAGVFLGPIVGGWLADHTGLSAPFYLAGVAAISGAGALWGLFPSPGRHHRPRPS